MNERVDRIEEAHSATFDWIFAQQTKLNDEKSTREGNAMPFPEWLSKEDEPVFWISGKAGSGKSTLMKWICGYEETQQRLQAWAQKKPLFMCRFFLYELGTDLGKCREGMLRSILHQLLSSIHGLQLVKMGYPRSSEDMRLTIQPDQSWSILRHVFNKVLSAMAELDWKLCLFVDGLDEYRNVEKWKKNQYSDADLEMVYEGEDGDEVWGSNMSIMDDHREVLLFFKSLCIRYRSNLKLCLSSRELMIFEDGLGAFPRLRMQECTKSDIARFVGDQVSQMNLERDEKEALAEKITTKSCGVFLWVRLVVKSVLDGYACGDTLKRLQEKVDQAPSRLCGPRGLFMKMLEPAIRDPQARLESCRIFKMMNSICRYKPTALPVEWIWYGLEGCENDKENFELALRMPVNLGKPVDTTKLRKEARRVVTGRSGNLLECEPPQYRVTFMHYTVYQFITRKGVWDLFPVDHLFNPLLSLLSAIIIQIKQNGRDMIERNPDHEGPMEDSKKARTDNDQTFTSLFRQAMGVAITIDGKNGHLPIYVKLIDELDRTMTEIYHQVPISQLNHCYWPHHSPPRYDNFLLNAADWSLKNYIVAKLQIIHSNDEHGIRKSSTKLLRDLIKRRAHFLTILRKPELVQGLENAHPSGDGWWLRDSKTIGTLVKLGADLEEIWDDYLSLGYAIAAGPHPSRGHWSIVWVNTLTEVVELGFDPFRTGKISCEHWMDTATLPTEEVSVVDILNIMSKMGLESRICSLTIEKLQAIDRKGPVGEKIF